MQNVSKKLIQDVSIVILLMIVSWIYLFRPIMEPDFFWHLKTGSWILEHGSLPDKDPFLFTSTIEPDGRALLILRGYWLTQALYAAMVSWWGLWGILVVRVLMLAALFGMVWTAFRKTGVHFALASGLLISFSVFFLENYALERPQVVSFLGVGLIMLLYQRIRQNDQPLHYTWVVLFSSVLMVLWANAHGGFIMGQGMLIIILVIETLRFALTQDKHRQKPVLKRVIVMCLFGLLGSFCSAASVSPQVVLDLVGSSNPDLLDNNLEYHSVYTWLFINKNQKLWLVVLVFASGLVFSFKALRNKSYVEILLFAIFWYFALKHVRYVPIAMVYSLLFVAWNYAEARRVNVISFVVLAASLIGFGLWAPNDFRNFNQALQRGLLDPNQYPVAAANYLQDHGVTGPVLNSVNWGGYLIWRLGPAAQFYVDGRYLDLELMAQSKELAALKKGPSGQFLWQEVADRYRVDTALLPLYDRKGNQQLLARSFLVVPEWKLVYRDAVSVVFSRR